MPAPRSSGKKQIFPLISARRKDRCESGDTTEYLADEIRFVFLVTDIFPTWDHVIFDELGWQIINRSLTTSR
jgi:hypothetical protein